MIEGDDLFGYMEAHHQEYARALFKYMRKGEGEHKPEPIDECMGLIRIEVAFMTPTALEQQAEFWGDQPFEMPVDIRFACKDGQVGHIEFWVRIGGWGLGCKTPEEAADPTVGIIQYPGADGFVVGEYPYDGPDPHPDHP